MPSSQKDEAGGSKVLGRIRESNHFGIGFKACATPQPWPVKRFSLRRSVVSADSQPVSTILMLRIIDY